MNALVTVLGAIDAHDLAVAIRAIVLPAILIAVGFGVGAYYAQQGTRPPFSVPLVALAVVVTAAVLI